MTIRAIIFSFLAVALVWAILTQGVAAYLADSTPESVLYLNANQPTALLNLAGKLIGANDNLRNLEPILGPDALPTEEPISKGSAIIAAGQNDEGRSAPSETGSGAAVPDAASQIKDWVTRALRNDPLNAKALRMLGQLAHAASDKERTDLLMEAAAQRSLHESAALYWMVRKNHRQGNYPMALYYADALLRTRTAMMGHLMPMFGEIAEDPEASSHLKHLLTKDSRWRSQFFAALPSHITDARTPLEILLTVKQSPAPPDSSDLRSYLHFLVRHKFHELAYYTWLQFLPQEQLKRAGRLFNGDFETAPSGAPFDWRFGGGSGVAIQNAPRPDQPNERALLIEFGAGRAEFAGITQTILLSPGTYHLGARYKSDLQSERGLVWDVTCAGASTPLGESISVGGTDASWKDLQFSITVPKTDCTAQTVRLSLDARSASEKFVHGSIWYDSLTITPDPDAAKLPE